MEKARRGILFLLIPLLLIPVLAACGTNGGTSASASTTPPAQTITHTPPGVSTPPTSSVSEPLNGCPGKQMPTSTASTATVTLTLAARKRMTTVHPGDTVEVRLSSSLSWSGPFYLAPGILAIQPPAGYFLPAANACVWRFIASGRGTATLSFTGRPLCLPKRLCPRYIIQPIAFMVSVT